MVDTARLLRTKRSARRIDDRITTGVDADLLQSNEHHGYDHNAAGLQLQLDSSSPSGKQHNMLCIRRLLGQHGTAKQQQYTDIPEHKFCAKKLEL